MVMWSNDKLLHRTSNGVILLHMKRKLCHVEHKICCSTDNVCDKYDASDEDEEG